MLSSWIVLHEFTSTAGWSFRSHRWSDGGIPRQTVSYEDQVLLCTVWNISDGIRELLRILFPAGLCLPAAMVRVGADPGACDQKQRSGIKSLGAYRRICFRNGLCWNRSSGGT